MIQADKLIVKVMGDDILVTESEKPVFSGYKNINTHIRNKDCFIGKEEDIKRSMRRTQETIKSLTLTNFTVNDKWITLSFTDDIKDVNVVVKALKEFIAKLKKLFKNLSLIATLEVGEENGRIHIHMVANLDFIEWKKLMELWGNGGAYIKNIYDINGIADYIAKQYVYDPTHPLSQLVGKRKFWRSGKLKKPLTFKGKEGYSFLKQNKNDLYVTGSESYDTFFKGFTTKTRLKRKKRKEKSNQATVKVNRRNISKCDTIMMVKMAIVDLNTRSARKIAEKIGKSPSYVQSILNNYIE